jgi:cob(I)alamin adenosyltransferase
MEKGLVHLYWGDGKGKTTAAMGVALRALAAGKKVVIVQFLKGRESGEVKMLSQLGAKIYRGKSGQKFVFQMTQQEKAETRKTQEENLLAALSQPADLLILDEACAALKLGMVDETLLKRVVLEKPEEQELILTGRDPADWMEEAADYSTEMHCWRHPYEKGIAAREGVEY